MLSHHFPIAIFKDRVENTDVIQGITMPWVEEEYEKNPCSFDNPWDNDLFTTYGRDVGFDWQSVLSLFVPSIEKMGHELCLNGRAAINTAWLNAYKTGQSHDLHDHLPSQFAAIYYLKFNPEVHSPAVFINPYRQGSLSSAPRDVDPMNTHPQWTLQSVVPVEEGDLLIFPGFLEHRVPRQQSDELRVTLSFNFSMIP